MEMGGSLQNRLAERCVMPKPEVGMGATELMWTDRHAYEIIAVKDDRHCTVRAYNAQRKEGTDWLDQKYDYIPDPNGVVKELFKTNKGKWVERLGRRYGSKFAVGYAREYYDPSF